MVGSLGDILLCCKKKEREVTDNHWAHNYRWVVFVAIFCTSWGKKKEFVMEMGGYNAPQRQLSGETDDLKYGFRRRTAVM